MMFVTLNQAKAHLEVIHNGDDPLILAIIQGASGAVFNYLKSSRHLFEPERDSNYQPVTDSNGAEVPARDSNGAKVIRNEVQSATLLQIGYLYRNRDENPDEAFYGNYLPLPVKNLLYMLRDPLVM